MATPQSNALVREALIKYSEADIEVGAALTAFQDGGIDAAMRDNRTSAARRRQEGIAASLADALTDSSILATTRHVVADVDDRSLAKMTANELRTLLRDVVEALDGPK